MFLPEMVADPLLSSPQMTMRHNDEMASIQRYLSEDKTLDTNENSLDDENENEEEADGAFQQLMQRGNYLRQLRLLALADEAERNATAEHPSSGVAGDSEEKKEDFLEEPLDGKTAEELEDAVAVIPSTGDKILCYDSFLAHQRYYDDLKHVDIKYMDFGSVFNAAGESGGRLVVEQCKKLGKGGFCWDAGFVLAEHIVANEAEWNAEGSQRILELGAGTGLCGLMVAKATNSHVVVTDLPELEHLMEANVKRNFDSSGFAEMTGDNTWLVTDDGRAKGTASSKVLRWGVEEDYDGAPYDVILGADIVASLYDPVALAQTLYALSGPNTKIYISSKSRLDRPHEEFDQELNRLFSSVRKIYRPHSRLRNPNVFIIAAEGKRHADS